MNMKYSLILLFVTYSIAQELTTVLDEGRILVNEVDRKCNHNCGTTPEQLVKSDPKDFVHMPEEIKCYLECFMVNFGVIRNNEIQVEKLVELVSYDCVEDKKEILERVKSCKDIKGSSSRDKCVKITECIYLNDFCTNDYDG